MSGRLDPQAIAAHLEGYRFYAAKAEPIDSLEILAEAPLAACGGETSDSATSTRLVIARVRHAQSSESYQLLLDPAGRDVMGDNATRLGELLARGAVPLGAAHGDLSALTGLNGRPLGQEQSNTTLVFSPAGGEPEVAVKFFRKLAGGVNPEIELLSAIDGCPFVPRLFGWVDAEIDGEPVALATVQEFIAGSRDGWLDALEFAAFDTDFTERARALGKATRGVHDALARALGTEQVSAEVLLGRLEARLSDTASGEVAERARIRYRELLGAATVQRIHGDLHLGQVLVTGSGYRLIDFEGEPARPLAERRRPDPVERDLAGLIRSLDYAAHFPSYAGQAAGPQDPEAWAANAREALLTGYGLEDSRRSLVAAYVLDKALYEVAYEENNRPEWAGIPRAAVRRILSASR